MQSRSAVKRSGSLVSILLLNFILSSASALMCRSDEGPSDADLKRVARNCMQKIGENSYASNQHSNWSSGSGSIGANVHYYAQQTPNQQQQQKEQQQQHDHWNDGGQNSRGKNYFTGYDEQNDSDENFYGDVRGRNNSNNNNDRDYSGDILSQRNRERMQTQQHSGRSSNNERNSRKRDSNGTGGSQRSSSSTGSGSNGNNNNKNNNHYNNINKNNNKNNNNENNNGNSLDAACIVHCFFDEMNMLNQEGFPDRYKITYELTKDLRDRELRSFYAETIQECFRYLESQRRRSDTCQFSRELIRCMTEYARANCDDWDNYHVMFN